VLLYDNKPLLKLYYFHGYKKVFVYIGLKFSSHFFCQNITPLLSRPTIKSNPPDESISCRNYGHGSNNCQCGIGIVSESEDEKNWGGTAVSNSPHVCLVCDTLRQNAIECILILMLGYAS
jgi:hypothetical protein